MRKKESNVFAVMVCLAMHMHEGIHLKTDLKHDESGGSWEIGSGGQVLAVQV